MRASMVARSLALAMAACVVAAPLVAAPVYRHLEADGSVVFSDESRAGQRVDLKPITVVDPDVPEVATPSAPRDEASQSDAFKYARFDIASPANEQTLPTGQAGNVQVRLAIEPALRQGDRVQLRVDGNVRQSPMHTSVFAVTGLERGEHRLVAELLSAQGEVRLATPPVTLYVQRATVNLPANPNSPGS